MIMTIINLFLKMIDYGHQNVRIISNTFYSFIQIFEFSFNIPFAFEFKIYSYKVRVIKCTSECTHEILLCSYIPLTPYGFFAAVGLLLFHLCAASSVQARFTTNSRFDIDVIYGKCIFQCPVYAVAMASKKPQILLESL